MNGKPVVPYLILAILTVWALALQVHLSRERIRLERSFDFSIPVGLEPFTAKVEHAYATIWETGQKPRSRATIRQGDTVIRINGQPFAGFAMYLRELGRRPAAPDPILITVRGAEGRTREFEFDFPNCTCGIPTLFEAVSIWAVPSLYCIAAGSITVAFRPKAPLAWSWFALMLAFSQLQVMDGSYADLRLQADTMAISGPARIPAVAWQTFVQYAWPAALVTAALALGGKVRWPLPHKILIALFLLFAIAKAAVEVGWSEGWNVMAPLYFLLRAYETYALAVAMLLLAAAAWAADRRLGMVTAAIALSTSAALFIGAASITEGAWVTYSDGIPRFDLAVPAFHRGPAAVVAIALTILLLTTLLLFRKHLTWQPAIAVALCLPLAVDTSGSLAKWWWRLQALSSEAWPWLIGVSAGPGLTLASYWIASPRNRTPSAVRI